MPYKRAGLLFALFVCVHVFAQDAWNFSHRLELRADYRWSDNERHPLRFPFPADFQPPVFLETVDAGHHVELNVADLQLEASYGNWLAARAKVHVQAKHRRNPTSEDRRIDADELFVRVGPYPEILERPSGTSLFLQAGKFAHMERQPVRLLESYGLAATSFNRFEDVQVLVGGTIGRSLYWRGVAANGNPLFFRDPNALAGDNGTDARRPPDPHPKLKSGFPILYNAETEDLFFSTKHVQYGEGLGYRWQSDDQTLGFDVLLFHYRRSLADTEKLTGTFYGGDLDLIDEVLPGLPRPLPLSGRRKEEYGARLYAEWRRATTTLQFTKQNIAGLQREGWEGEFGYEFPLRLGWIRSVQPAVRISGLTNRFRGNALAYPAPSIWWQWTKGDAGVRIGLPHGLDLTVEATRHNIGSARKLHLRETLATLRWRV